jgi:hypothetical protein
MAERRGGAGGTNPELVASGLWAAPAAGRFRTAAKVRATELSAFLKVVIM